MTAPNWPAIRDHCARGEWHAAYNDAGLCKGKGDTAWQAAADYIETCKAQALAALTAARHARKRKDAA